jgi:pyrroline-5-carboxylate reductase
MKIAILGCGNMGLAFARSFLQYELVKKENLLLIEKNEERCQMLTKTKEGVVVNTINDNISTYDLVILAVKPQDFEVLAHDIKRKTDR